MDYWDPEYDDSSKNLKLKSDDTLPLTSEYRHTLLCILPQHWLQYRRHPAPHLYPPHHRTFPPVPHTEKFKFLLNRLPKHGSEKLGQIFQIFWKFGGNLAQGQIWGIFRRVWGSRSSIWLCTWLPSLFVNSLNNLKKLCSVVPVVVWGCLLREDEP